jgi:hypothetical protein
MLPMPAAAAASSSLLLPAGTPLFVSQLRSRWIARNLQLTDRIEAIAACLLAYGTADPSCIDNRSALSDWRRVRQKMSAPTIFGPQLAASRYQLPGLARQRTVPQAVIAGAVP